MTSYFHSMVAIIAAPFDCQPPSLQPCHQTIPIDDHNHLNPCFDLLNAQHLFQTNNNHNAQHSKHFLFLNRDILSEIFSFLPMSMVWSQLRFVSREWSETSIRTRSCIDFDQCSVEEFLVTNCGVKDSQLKQAWEYLFAYILRNCRNLKRFCIKLREEREFFNNSHLKMLAQRHGRTLQELELTNCVNITENLGFDKTFRKYFVNLRKLSVIGNRFIHHSVLRHLTKLESLRIEKCDKFYRSGDCSRSFSQSLMYFKTDKCSPKHISHLRNLKLLDLSEGSIESQNFRNLSDLSTDHMPDLTAIETVKLDPYEVEHLLSNNMKCKVLLIVEKRCRFPLACMESLLQIYSTVKISLPSSMTLFLTQILSLLSKANVTHLDDDDRDRVQRLKCAFSSMLENVHHEENNLSPMTATSNFKYWNIDNFFVYHELLRCLPFSVREQFYIEFVERERQEEAREIKFRMLK
ncbi:hypothetical protein FDP41_008131 [Naegleria fowleri]|uniref:F-box domain-containing protein n=1 Tax=Naegleria fowleri TaxID=5763 RepID=A0A6A5B7B6_NAEFO|nr:uncharacterized protein FDP41_008131 [Naegleria fowleri]KAF0973427.1 hypothetical protein FDP41_008131 [Naegleria fowleri]